MEWKISDQFVPYPAAIEFMEQRVTAIYEHKAEECVWLLEHPELYTAGTSANTDDLLDPKRFPVYQAGRGGEYTYHGPGQRIAYVMLNLARRNQQDIRAYVYHLEQWIINSLDRFGVDGQRRDGRIGIWVKTGDTEAKIAAIGVRVRRWVTFHGIAINVNPNLEHFKGIVPCGIQHYGVTSLDELGITPTTEDVDQVLNEEFIKIFL